MAKAKKSVKAKKKSVATKKNLRLKTKKKVVKKAVKKSAAKRKAKKVMVVPKGYTSVIPYLIVNNGAQAIEFYKKVFGAKELMRMPQPNGKVGHAELKIGDTIVMMADECEESKARSPEKFGGSPVIIHLYIKDVDSVVNRAVAAGARLARPVETMFYGDRSGVIVDPHGHIWNISTHVEDVTPAQIKKRMAEIFGKN